jgi:hypothetical protein
MKKIILLLHLLVFSFISHAEVLNFDFFGTDDKGHYNSTTLNQDLQKEYGPSMKAHAIILLESNSSDNQYFKAQNDIIDHAPHGTFEALATIIVVSLTDEVYQSGYHVSVGTANRLMTADPNDFRITILSPAGEVIKRSSQVMPLEELIRNIKR